MGMLQYQSRRSAPRGPAWWPASDRQDSSAAPVGERFGIHHVEPLPGEVHLKAGEPLDRIAPLD